MLFAIIPTLSPIPVTKTMGMRLTLIIMVNHINLDISACQACSYCRDDYVGQCMVL